MKMTPVTVTCEHEWTWLEVAPNPFDDTGRLVDTFYRCQRCGTDLLEPQEAT